MSMFRVALLVAGAFVPLSYSQNNQPSSPCRDEDSIRAVADPAIRDCENLTTPFQSFPYYEEELQLDPEVRTCRPWLSMDPTFCAVVTTPPEPVTVAVGRTTSEEVCWEFGATVTAEAGEGFVARLFARLGVSVEISGQRSSCKEVSESTDITLTSTACWKRFVRECVSTRRARLLGGQKERVTWRCASTNVEQGFVCWLGSVKLLASATHRLGAGIQIAPYPCGPGHEQIPDVYDGKRMEPCCRPLGPCDITSWTPTDEYPSPCCGVLNNN